MTATPAFAVSGVVASVSVVLGQNSVSPGASTSVTVTLTDAEGRPVAGKLITLSSSSASVTLAATSGTSSTSGTFVTTATVSSSATNGTATITATSGGVSGSAAVSYATPGTVTGSTTYSGVPYGTALSPDGSLLYIAGTTTTQNGPPFYSQVSRDSVTVVDAATLAVIRTVFINDFGVVPTWVHVTPSGSTVRVANGNQFGVIDTASSTWTNTGGADNGGGYAATDVRLSPDGLYSYFALWSQQAPRPGIGRWNDTGSPRQSDMTTPDIVGLERLVVTPDGSAIFAVKPQNSLNSNADAALYRINVATTAATKVNIPAGAGTDVTMAISPDGSTIYFVGMHNVLPGNASPAQKRQIMAFDVASNSVLWRAASSYGPPVDMQVSPDGSRLYMVASNGDLSVMTLSTKTATAVASAPFAGTASYPCLSLSPNGTRAYVSLRATTNTTTASKVYAVAL